MTSPKDPAFPTAEMVHFKSGDAIGRMGGLTKREYFAAMAMQGIIAVNQIRGTELERWDSTHQWMAHQAAMCADALIAELNK